MYSRCEIKVEKGRVGRQHRPGCRVGRRPFPRPNLEVRCFNILDGCLSMFLAARLERNDRSEFNRPFRSWDTGSKPTSDQGAPNPWREYTRKVELEGMNAWFDKAK